MDVSIVDIFYQWNCPQCDVHSVWLLSFWILSSVLKRVSVLHSFPWRSRFQSPAHIMFYLFCNQLVAVGLHPSFGHCEQYCCSATTFAWTSVFNLWGEKGIKPGKVELLLSMFLNQSSKLLAALYFKKVHYKYSFQGKLTLLKLAQKRIGKPH
jgi:hypothetical protein